MVYQGILWLLRRAHRGLTRRSKVEQEKAGFTLVEVLVSLAVFSVIATIATSMTLSFYRTQRKTESMEELSFAARSLMERLAQEIREGEINYQAYTGGEVVLPEDTLYLTDVDSQPIIFQKFEEDCPQDAATCLKISNDGTNWSSLTPRGIKVDDLRFYITPQKNPFAFDEDLLTYQAQDQPSVTILLALEKNKPGLLGQKEKVSLQTSVSSRIYRR